MDSELRKKKLDELRKRAPYSEMEILYNNQREKKPVYQIPLDFLIYNKFNGRIASMVKSFERQNRELDASKTDDREIIERFLYQSNPGRNKTTKEDLDKHHQLRYGIVTRDGVIIDGNRRAMLLGRLAAEKNERPGYFKAVILDDCLTDNPREIMRLETTYQLGEDEKLGYNAIEKYLKVKDLKENEFDDRDIGSMMGLGEEAEEEVQRLHHIMALMDSYLDTLGYNGIYTRLDGTEGIFVDLNQYLERYKKTQTSFASWPYTPNDLVDLQVIFFDLIRARFSGDGKMYRDLGRPSKKESFFCNQSVWNDFKEFHFENIEPVTNSEKSVDEIRRENPGKSLDELLKQRDLDWEEKVSPKIKENFGKSRRRLDDINAQNSPLELLRRAFQTLQTIDVNAEAFWSSPDVEQAVSEINSLTYNFKKMIKEKRNHH